MNDKNKEEVEQLWQQVRDLRETMPPAMFATAITMAFVIIGLLLMFFFHIIGSLVSLFM